MFTREKALQEAAPILERINETLKALNCYPMDVQADSDNAYAPWAPTSSPVSLTSIDHLLGIDETFKACRDQIELILKKQKNLNFRSLEITKTGYVTYPNIHLPLFNALDMLVNINNNLKTIEKILSIKEPAASIRFDQYGNIFMAEDILSVDMAAERYQNLLETLSTES